MLLCHLQILEVLRCQAVVRPLGRFGLAFSDQPLDLPPRLVRVVSRPGDKDSLLGRVGVLDHPGELYAATGPVDDVVDDRAVFADDGQRLYINGRFADASEEDKRIVRGTTKKRCLVACYE